MQIRSGQRFRSTVCDTAVVVVRGGEVDLRCGGDPMVAIDDTASETGGSPAEGFDSGTQLGKRYWDEESEIELMCTAGGDGALSVGERILTFKPAKPLPSSD